MNLYSIAKADSSEELMEECIFFHKLMFGSEPSINFIGHYIACHKLLSHIIDVDEKEYRSLRKIIDKKLNGLIIEPWIRKRPQSHLLSMKIFFISYIAECDSQHSIFKMNKNNGLTVAIVSIFYCGFTAVIDMLHGFYLVKKHGII